MIYDTLCALLSDVIDSQHSSGSYHELGTGLCESRPFSRLSKCPLPLSLQLKITPSLPIQFNVLMTGSRNVSCSAKSPKNQIQHLILGEGGESKIL